MVSDLRQFGMNEYEAISYAVLVGKGPLTASLISKYSKVPQSKVYEVMRSLQDKAFIECFETKPQRFKAIDPSLALAELVSKKRSLINTLEQKAKQIADSLKIQDSLDEQEVWVSKGKSIFLKKLIEAVRDSTEEIRIMTSDFIRNPDLDDALMKANKKVKIRILCPANISESSKVRSRWYNKIADIKIADSPNHNFIISNNTAYIMTNDNPVFEFVTSSNKAIVNAVNHYFEHLWQCGDDFSD